MIYIKNIKLNNFRCFKTIDLEFKPNINILIGENGSGKTSIVEGISYLCIGKSFKNAKDKEVLRFNEEYFNVISTIYDNVDTRLVVGYDGNHKRIKKGENIYKSLSEHIGVYRLITFSPDDLYIIKGSPSDRRRFLDTFISQYDPIYLKALSEYKKILKIRNDFLKSIENNSFDTIMFDVINQKMIDAGKKVIELRNKYISILNENIKKVSNDLTNHEFMVEIKYNPDVEENIFKKTILDNKKIDILSKITTKGPQKDDLDIYINNNNAISYSSQGQIRVAVLSMKLGIYELFNKINNNIIIILDDVFSELDNNKQIYLMEYIQNVGQVFITTTDIYKLPKNIKEISNIIEIKEGKCDV